MKLNYFKIMKNLNTYKIGGHMSKSERSKSRPYNYTQMIKIGKF